MIRYLKNMFIAAETNVRRFSLICLLALAAGASLFGCLLSPILGAMIVSLLLWCNRKSSRNSPWTHGTAEFAGFADLCRAGCLFQPSGVPLGNAAGMIPPSIAFAVYCLLTFPARRSADALAIATMRGSNPVPLAVRVPDRYPHVAIYAASGGGKSSCYAFPYLLDCPDSIVVLDAKGELAKGTARYRHHHFKSEIIIIDPYGVTEGSGFPRSHFNPLDLFRGDENRIVDAAPA